MNDRLNPDKVNTRHPAAPYTAADLPIDEDGRIYHLQIKPGQIAPDILLVGDPGRAEMIGSTFLRDLEVEHEHRGLVTVTGTSEITGEQATVISPVKATAATSGIGTPSLEIVVNELVALNEIDFETRTRKSDFPRLHVLRVGTSGGLQASTKLGTPIVTSCSAIANRREDTFDSDYQESIANSIRVALLALADVRSRYPDVRMS